MLWLLVMATTANAVNLFASTPVFYTPAEWSSNAARTTPGVPINWTDTGVAVWVDTIANIAHLKIHLQRAKQQHPSPLVAFVVYNLPNRDCAAVASAGEQQCDIGDASCKKGLQLYRSKFIDPLVKMLKTYHKSVPMVAILEPDSLANLATNKDHPACRNSEVAYTSGIQYAVQELASKTPNIAIYLDAAHGGWLGWPQNQQSFQTIVSSMNILPRIRGFAINVANYQPLGSPCTSANVCTPDHSSESCCDDPCKLVSQWNPCPTEITYAQALAVRFPGKTVIIDTGRNGNPRGRSSCSMWCNPNNMGFGLRPTAKTHLPSIVDAYYWIKPPGESDGCSRTLADGSQCSRFDAMCGSPETIAAPAPEAGQWFPEQFQVLARNAIWNKNCI